ncbi:MAG: ketoacyl-ACP synthase III [Flavobacteriales bacterium]|jgi:3-oxoacyl-[acyl-carrier-protein] synthase-3|nr:ketoacyl-ACP synthase III [Flavobacteriales bacterium]MBK6893054.1 ketoacyl-ACP synthase III [Flavobacteriales bacterium]MBK7249226.1 ketoacyl-ACP synthase III [Flavobacteriales bacterium]MBK9058540.1 ketoacyl-ACP synthase III [Flavobacteriales bacterium]MBK9599749.1 ketoacyl-ACP synthase III [Flavobacteriales bacterium]
MKTTAAITAVQGYVPDFVLSNAVLETMVDTNDAWITERTGIKERRILKGKDQGMSVMAVEAVKGLCTKRGIDPMEIDLLICCTVTPDMQFPASANIVCDKVGAKNAWSFDLNAACSGFLFGLVTGAQFIETGKYKKVVVVGADKMSSIIDYTDRSTCIIFGDGGGAVLLEPNNEGFGVVDSILRSDGSGCQYLHQKAGGSMRPASIRTVEAKEHFVFQEGKAVFKFAVTNMAGVSAEIMERNQLTSDDVAWLVPHQANKRIIDATAHRMGLDENKVMLNIEKYGNTTSGTIPLCLWEWEDRLKKGDNLILSAFGGGFTWGAIYLKWAYGG